VVPKSQLVTNHSDPGIVLRTHPLMYVREGVHDQMYVFERDIIIVRSECVHDQMYVLNVILLEFVLHHLFTID
jgi:hypothetical protein